MNGFGSYLSSPIRHERMQPKEPRTIDGAEHWMCGRCSEWKTADLYYPDRRTPNGLKSQCKACHSECTIRTRDKENHRTKRREHAARSHAADPEKYRAAWRKRPPKKGPKVHARQLVHLALRKGLITRPQLCEDCQQRKRITAHHEDYSKPLEVKWLCFLCHARRHHP